ncbi:MAG TPA: hypothetical protein PKK60_00475 [archaeon]|nr:hypothetical protein [archaeon]
MGGTLTYNSQKRFKTANESVISLAGEFPKCKGLYPDCPNEPSLMNPMCRTCPKTEGLKKPKLDEVEEEVKETKVEEEVKETKVEEETESKVEEEVKEINNEETNTKTTSSESTTE